MNCYMMMGNREVLAGMNAIVLRLKKLFMRDRNVSAFEIYQDLQEMRDFPIFGKRSEGSQLGESHQFLVALKISEKFKDSLCDHEEKVKEALEMCILPSGSFFDTSQCYDTQADLAGRSQEALGGRAEIGQHPHQVSPHLVLKAEPEDGPQNPPFESLSSVNAGKRSVSQDSLSEMDAEQGHPSQLSLKIPLKPRLVPKPNLQSRKPIIIEDDTNPVFSVVSKSLGTVYRRNPERKKVASRRISFQRHSNHSELTSKALVEATRGMSSL